MHRVANRFAALPIFRNTQLSTECPWAFDIGAPDRCRIWRVIDRVFSLRKLAGTAAHRGIAESNSAPQYFLRPPPRFF
jgi:hypothetical protein